MTLHIQKKVQESKYNVKLLLKIVQVLHCFTVFIDLMLLKLY